MARLADSGTIAVEIVTPALPVLVDTATEIVADIRPVQQVQSGVQAHASLVPVTLDSCAQVEPLTTTGQQMVVSVQGQAEAEDAPSQPSTPVIRMPLLSPAPPLLHHQVEDPGQHHRHPLWLGGIKQLGRQWQLLHLLQVEWPHLHHHHHHHPQVEVRQAQAAHHHSRHHHHHPLAWSRLVWQGPSRCPGALRLLRALL